jgi:tryptophan-rich sensory protein
MKNKGVKLNKALVFIICIAAVAIVAVLGSSYTKNETKSPWYNQIKPAITPPNWVFPIIWTVLYIFIAFAMYYSITSPKAGIKERRVVILAFMSNLLLNFLWTPLFFYIKNPIIALIDLIFLWISIITIMLFTRKISKITFYLMIPYLLWVSFAGILNALFI